MPTQTQYDVVQQQVLSFKLLGCVVRFEMQPQMKDAAPKIVIANAKKSWRFCDPDWDIVSRQLSMLYRHILRMHGEPI